MTGDELDAVTPLTSSSTYDNISVQNYALFRSDTTITVNSTLTLTSNGIFQTYTGGNLTYSTFTWDTNTTLIDDGGTFDFLSGGGSLTVPSGRTLNANTARTYSDVTINGNLKHGINSTAEVYKINLTTTGDFTIASGATVNLDRLGYYVGYGTGKGANGSAFRGSGGGAHGGDGGDGTGSSGTVAGGTAYGSITDPVTIGSGAGFGYTTTRNLAKGGGAIKLTVGGTLSIGENISVNGLTGSGSGTGDADGGGAGGSINLTANEIVGAGNLSANGGDGYSVSGAKGGGGGGGRIAVNSGGSSSYTGTVSVTGGSATNPGSVGTYNTTSIPQKPTSLSQFKIDGVTAIATGESTNETSVVLKVTMAAGENSTLTPEFEIRPNSTSFSDTATNTGSGISYTGTPVTGSTTITGLVNGSSYHWQARVCDGTTCSLWVAGGGNPDFTISTAPPAGPTGVELSSPGANNYTNNVRPTFRWHSPITGNSNLSKYTLTIDNPDGDEGQVAGDFTIDNLPVRGTTDIETNTYTLHYEGFDDSDHSNDYLALTTKSSNAWSSDSLDGKLREGIVKWTVTATATDLGTTSLSRFLYVDVSGPTLGLAEVGGIAIGPSVTTGSTRPVFAGKLTDATAGGSTSTTQDDYGPKIASGPKEVRVEIKEYKGKNLNPYTTFTFPITQF